MNENTTVFVVDDDPAVRDALTLLIEQEGLPVKAFASAEDFLACCQTQCSGCIIIDIRMSGMGGMQLHEEIVRRGCLLPVIFLTGHGDIPMSVRAIKAGAVDFLTKPITRDLLMHSVRAALAERDSLQVQVATSQAAQSRMAILTEREKEVMQLLLAGHANKEVGRLLGISHRTVEIHKARLMKKTGATSLLDLARLVEESGGPSPF
jgi:FixJ family two-component response regulator